MEFAIRTDRPAPGVVVLSVTGEIDLFTAPEFKEEVGGAVVDDTRLLVVDLTRTAFLDSSSLGVLITAHRRLRGHGGRLVVASDREPILRVLRVTGLDGVFQVVGAASEALPARAA